MKNLNNLNLKRSYEGEKFIFNKLGDNRKGVFTKNINGVKYYIIAISDTNKDRLIISCKKNVPTIGAIKEIVSMVFYKSEIKDVEIEKRAINENIKFLCIQKNKKRE